MATIIVESGAMRGKVFNLPARGAVEAGREPSCSLAIQDNRVSRHHFRLVGDGKAWTLEDSGSSNGTFVNGKRVEKTPLRNGDLVRAGGVFLSFTADPADPLLGQTIAGYTIESRIGRGGMGTVYRARQLSLDRPVALKILSQALTEDRELTGRFLEEARMAAKLDHPNIVRVYDVGQEEHQFFISMEFMAGGSLQEMIDKRGALPAEKAAGMILDAAKALVWAGEQRIVHRDIKPDNLLIADDGTVKVADFGVAADQRTSKTLYAGGKVLGTPGYMAPEQALGKPVDHRADIYALGSTLYAVLSGTPPFEGDTPVAVLLKKAKEPPKPLAEAAPGAPREVVAVVEKMMAREPKDRYANAADAHAALANALEALKHREESSDPDGAGAGGRLSRAFRGAMGKLAPGRKKPAG